MRPGVAAPVIRDATRAKEFAGRIAEYGGRRAWRVAHLREVGWKSGRWVDVGYWQPTP